MNHDCYIQARLLLLLFVWYELRKQKKLIHNVPIALIIQNVYCNVWQMSLLLVKFYASVVQNCSWSCTPDQFCCSGFTYPYHTLFPSTPTVPLPKLPRCSYYTLLPPLHLLPTDSYTPVPTTCLTPYFPASPSTTYPVPIWLSNFSRDSQNLLCVQPFCLLNTR